MKSKIRIGAFYLVLMFGLFVVPFAYGSEFRRTVMQVEQMICSSCLRVIDAELRKIPGITGMTAVFSEGRVVVDHEVGVTSKEIADAITGLGYPATAISVYDIADREANRFKRARFGGGAGCCNPGGASPVVESWKELKRRFFRQGREGRQDR